MDQAALAALKTVGVEPGKKYDASQVPKIDAKRLAAVAAESGAPKHGGLLIYY